MNDQRRITTLALLKSLIEASGGCDQVIAVSDKGGPLEQALAAALGVHDRVCGSENVSPGTPAPVPQVAGAGGSYEIEELDRKSPTRLRVKLRPFDRSEDHPGWVTAWDRHGEAIEQAGAGARIEGKLVEKKGHMNVEVVS
ncbi:MAG: hypothetical protein CBC48_07790 [bacterium TMED88]|nr:hypothetical protein [Deltaproteobacteria bacterium]OUV32769.1 MAG: hypothetical protein CBC48_07790 [bacterium TMED88]